MRSVQKDVYENAGLFEAYQEAKELGRVINRDSYTDYDYDTEWECVKVQWYTAHSTKWYTVIGERQAGTWDEYACYCYHGPDEIEVDQEVLVAIVRDY